MKYKEFKLKTILESILNGTIQQAWEESSPVHAFVPPSWENFKSLNGKPAAFGLRVMGFCYAVDGEYTYCIVKEPSIRTYIFREKGKSPQELYKDKFKYNNSALSKPVSADSVRDLLKNKIK